MAIENNVVIYTVGLGASIDEKLLTEMAIQTGGKYYNAADVTDIIEEFGKCRQNYRRGCEYYN